MPITITGVTLTVSPANVPCPPSGGTSTVTVTINGSATGVGNTYDVELYDLDAQQNDLLDSALNNTVTGGSAVFPLTHTFTLSCDDSCEVRGTLGSSGEQKPTIQAFVNIGGATVKKSNTKVVKCGAGAYRPRRDKS